MPAKRSRSRCFSTLPSALAAAPAAFAEQDTPADGSPGPLRASLPARKIGRQRRRRAQRQRAELRQAFFLTDPEDGVAAMSLVNETGIYGLPAELFDALPAF